MTELEREDDGYQDLIMDENERRKLQSYNINKEMKINTTRVSRWVEGGVLWTCTQCGKQGKMKHHVRWVQQHSLAWCVMIDILILGNT